jgi:phage terminase large subunit-like protein
MAKLPPRVASAFAWAKGIAAGKIPAGRLCRLAVARFERDLEASANGGPWEFRPDIAEHALGFFGLVQNVKGPQAGQRIEVLPWQAFAFANLLGWVERGT